MTASSELDAAAEPTLPLVPSHHDWRPTVLAAVLSSAAVVLLIVAFAQVSVAERPVVTVSLSGSVREIAAALIGGCSTIAALTLTTISLLERLETRQLGPPILFHIRLTVFGAVLTIVFAMGLLLLTTVPIADRAAAQVPHWQIDGLFYGLLILLALMVGAFAVVLTSLSATVTDVLRTLPRDVVQEIAAEPSEPVRT